MDQFVSLKGAQTLALSCPADEILLHGTRGGSKTATQLVRFAMHTHRGFGAFWRGIIFDQQYSSLDDMVSQSKKIMPLFDDGAKWYASKGDYRWVFSDGAELLFRHAQSADDYSKYHGFEAPYIGINELTKYPDDEFYKLIQSCIRSSYVPQDGQPDLPMVQFSTTNPLGSGHNWVKKRFIDGAPDKKIQREVTQIYNPRTQRNEDIERSRVAIFSSYKDNKYLDPRYVATLEDIKDPNYRKAWLEGDWSVTAGGAVDDLWDASKHILPHFKIPESWTLWRGFDNGSSQPFGVCFIAFSNGEEAKLPDGSKFCPPPHTAILLDVIYGGIKDADGNYDYASNKGIKAPVREVAQMIKDKEYELMEDGITVRRFDGGTADNAIFNLNDTEFGSLADIMEEEEIYWGRSDKSAGSRMRSLSIFRQMLQATLDGEGAGFYTMGDIEPFRETVVTLPRDKKKVDEVDTTANDHIFDSLVYPLVSRNMVEAQAVSFGFDF